MNPLTQAQAQSGRATLIAIAAVLLALAVNHFDGRYIPGRTYPGAMLACAMAVALLAVALPEVAIRRLGRPRSLLTVAGIGLAAYFCVTFFKPPGNYPYFVIYYRTDGPSQPAWINMQYFWMMTGAAAVLCGSLISARPLLGRATVPALVILQFVLAVWIIRSDPQPFIDVWHFEQTAAAAVLHGYDPYGTNMPDIYQQDQRFYGSAMQTGTPMLTMQYPYMPLTLPVMVGGYAAGDVRYALDALLAASALVIAFTVRSPIGAMAAAALLFMPRTLFVIDRGWNEPVVVLLLSLTISSALRWPRAMPFMLGLLLASKQYMPFAIVLLPLLVGWDGARIVAAGWRACATAAVVTIPGFVAQPAGFWRSVVQWQFLQPFRPDSLGIPAILHDWNGGRWSLPPAVAFVVLAVVAALALWRLRPSPAAFAMALAISYLFFFAFSKQPFLNYYFFVISAMWCAVAAAQAPPAPKATEKT